MMRRMITMQEYIFDENKKYKITFLRDGKDLTFTASNVKIIGALISFTDKFNQQIIFPIDAIRQAGEVKLT